MNTQLRVLIVSPYYPPATEWGGPTFSIPMLARAVRETGVDLEVFTTNGRGEPGLPRVSEGVHEVDSVPVHYFNSLGPRRYLFSPGMTLELLKKARAYDVVHIQGVFMYPTLAASRICQALRVPYIVTPRGMLDPWSLKQKGPKKWIYLGLCEAWSLLGAARIHYTSEDERRLVPSFVSSVPSVVVPNGVDVEAFDNVPREDRGGEAVRLIIAGRIHQKKGFDLLMPALGQVKEVGRRVHLTIAGPDEDDYSRQVKEMARRYGVEGDISFTGNLDRPGLAREFGRADIALMPSYQENFGMSAAEAMVTGLPIVVSDTVNIAPDIARCRAGIVIPLDAAHLAEAIQRLAAHPLLRREMGANGHSLVQMEYVPKVVALKMVAVYEDIQDHWQQKK